MWYIMGRVHKEGLDMVLFQRILTGNLFYVTLFWCVILKWNDHRQIKLLCDDENSLFRWKSTILDCILRQNW